MRLPFLTAILARNERDRYLPHVLDWHGQFGPILVLDDHSTDDTRTFCTSHPRVLRVVERDSVGTAWGREAPARAQLWTLAAEMAEWVLICDADQILHGDPRPLLNAPNVNAWAFPLYDCWNDPTTYRDDTYWIGHKHHRPWLFNPHRVPEGWSAAWLARGIHCGHAPANFPYQAAKAPDEYYWQHLAYVTPDHRVQKLARYRENYHQMTPDEQAHAESIADPHPTLKVLPFAKPTRILVGGPVRKRADVLRAHLQTLAAQELPPRVEVTYCFVDDYPAPDEGQQVLADFVAEHGGRVIKWASSPVGDFSDQHPETHQWTQSAMDRVGRIKTALMRECVTGAYDWLWLVDSDLLMDRTTLASLLSTHKPLVAGVFWTRWHTHQQIHAGPQVWLKPIYELALPHYSEAEFRRNVGVERGLVKVGGLGACTLIARHVIEKGVAYHKPPGFPSGGLWDGEDRHFCEWARRLHVELWADAWPDIWHCYHPQDAEQVGRWQATMADAHPSFANHGSLVNLTMTNVEDGIGPLHIRCRVGDGTMLPELEAAVLAMRRGDTKMLKVHFPVMDNVGPLALGGQIRLVQVTLVDCKPFGLPPVLADEYMVSSQGPVQDATQWTAAQQTSLAEQA